MRAATEEQLLKDVATIGTIVAKLDKTVNGNGKPGLDQRVGCVENTLQNHLNDAAEEKEDVKQKAEDAKDDKKRKKDFGISVYLLIIGMVVTIIGNVTILVIQLKLFASL